MHVQYICFGFLPKTMEMQSDGFICFESLSTVKGSRGHSISKDISALIVIKRSSIYKYR